MTKRTFIITIHKSRQYWRTYVFEWGRYVFA